tara:strand:+ start:1036 stop:1221 length:186 start_codon:yes stop_codon:yes gene_type:complete
MLDVAVIVAAIKLVTDRVGVWIEVAVTVPATMFVAERAAVWTFVEAKIFVAETVVTEIAGV